SPCRRASTGRTTLGGALSSAFRPDLLSSLVAGYATSLSCHFTGAGGELADAEDHELGRLDRADPDLDHDLACLDHVLRIGLRVALDEERLAGGGPEQRALAPGAGEEVRRGDAQRAPEPVVVGLEDGPLRALHDRLGDVVEEAPDV